MHKFKLRPLERHLMAADRLTCRSAVKLRHAREWRATMALSWSSAWQWHLRGKPRIWRTRWEASRA